MVFSDPIENAIKTYSEDTGGAGKRFDFYLQQGMRPKYLHFGHKQFLRRGKVYGKTLLDVGCGLGSFLYAAKERYTVTGIDCNKRQIEISRKCYNLTDVHPLTIEQFIQDYHQRRFDVVTFFETLEHISNPNEFIISVKKALNPKGYIGISVPNVDQADFYFPPMGPPGHVTGWSVRSLRNFLELNGFQIKKIVVKKYPTHELGEWFIWRLPIENIKQQILSEERLSLFDKLKILLMEVFEKILRVGLPILLWPLVIIGGSFLKGPQIFCIAQLKSSADTHI
ncbi:MAG: class I SAM-dependent methyltransferase [Nanoarchaeota archaeon]|nr:class I SAM-dependent methyltransferase [Nanoarchaeota archaeon]